MPHHSADGWLIPGQAANWFVCERLSNRVKRKEMEGRAQNPASTQDLLESSAPEEWTPTRQARVPRLRPGLSDRCVFLPDVFFQFILPVLLQCLEGSLPDLVMLCSLMALGSTKVTRIPGDASAFGPQLSYRLCPSEEQVSTGNILKCLHHLLARTAC